MKTKLLRKLRKEARKNFDYSGYNTRYNYIEYITYIKETSYTQQYNLFSKHSHKEEFIRDAILNYVRQLKYSKQTPFNNKELKKASKKLRKFKVK